MAGAGGLSLREQGEQPGDVHSGQPGAEGDPGDVPHEVSAVHPSALLPGHRAGSHHNPVAEPEPARGNSEHVRAPDDGRRVGQRPLTILDLGDSRLIQTQQRTQHMLAPPPLGAHPAKHRPELQLRQRSTQPRIVVEPRGQHQPRRGPRTRVTATGDAVITAPRSPAARACPAPSIRHPITVAARGHRAMVTAPCRGLMIVGR